MGLMPQEQRVRCQPRGLCQRPALSLTPCGLSSALGQVPQTLPEESPALPLPSHVLPTPSLPVPLPLPLCSLTPAFSGLGALGCHFC